MSDKHTPPPYEVCTDGDLIYIESVDGVAVSICDLYHLYDNGNKVFTKPNAKANAEFIVRACNSHEELFKVCNALLEYIDAIPDSVQLPTMPGIDRDWVEEVIAEAEPK